MLRWLPGKKASVRTFQIPLLGIYPKDVPTGKRDTCSTMFIAALFIIAIFYYSFEICLLGNLLVLFELFQVLWNYILNIL
jgi:hypothetical protein